MFCVLCSKLVTSVFWPLCFEFWILISIWRGWANCIKCSIIHIPVFVSLHSFFLYRGIRTFAVDIFIAPSKETMTLLKTYDTEHKRENSKHETQTSKHRSHKLWTQNSKHLHTKHSMYNGSVGRKNPQKLTQLSSRSHPRHLVGKGTAQKDTIIDITSDSQVISSFPYRGSPASLTYNNYFTYFYIYIYRE